MKDATRNVWQVLTRGVGLAFVIATAAVALYIIVKEGRNPGMTIWIALGVTHAVGWMAFSEKVVDRFLDAFEKVRGSVGG